MARTIPGSCVAADPGDMFPPNAHVKPTGASGLPGDVRRAAMDSDQIGHVKGLQAV